MPIQSIEITGLRGYATPQRLMLALPGGNPGSGVTVLTGPNNGGKSTIVEALRSFTQTRSVSFTEGKRNKKADERIRIAAEDTSGLTKELRTIVAGGSETEWIGSDNPPRPASLFVLPSRRYFNPFFGKSSYTREAYITSLGIPALRGASLDNFAVRLFAVQENRREFDKVLARVLDPVPDWKIEQADNGQYYIKVHYGGLYHNSEGLGEGLVSLFFIIDALYDSGSGDMIVIDEPELSLHPALQRKLADLLMEYGSDRQIVYATHSPYFVNFEAIANGAGIARVHTRDFSSTISQLSADSAKGIRGFLQNTNVPHILGLDAREIFFLDDQVILVEGQEDVIYYPKVAADIGKPLKGSFYGWGVGGAGNMHTIAKILHELGFAKVVGIVDDDKKEIIPRLQAQFPDYHFFSIPAKDVRTKRSAPAREQIEGLLDEDDHVRAQYKTAVSKIFDQINAAFEGKDIDTELVE